MSVTTELIAANKTLEGIKEYIEADAVIYLPLDDLKEIFSKLPTCMACLDGKYPTEGALEALRMIENERLESGGR
jgi:amidophosphoribosyltransferase